MIDVVTHKRVEIYPSTPGSPRSAGHLLVAEEQVGTVLATLKANDINHWQGDVVTIDDDPPVAIVELGPWVDVPRVQQLLDAI